MSTVYEVADLAGVSTATVSRVIHGSNLVHPDTRERVLAVIEQLGYVPDGSAQGLSRRRKDIIGLAALERGITEIGIEKTSPLFMDELVHAVETVLRGTDCSLLLTFGRAGDAFQRRVRSLSGKVDGLLVTEDVLPASQLRTLARRIPVVAIAGQRQEREIDVVAVDNAAGIRALAAHLIEEHGYQRLAFLAGPADSPDARERLVAFRQAVREHPGCVLDLVLGLGSGLQSCSGCETGYNTYSVIINRTNTSNESITWYLNGTAYYTVTEGQVDAAAWQAAVDHGFFLILDVAIGGGYPNGVCGWHQPLAGDKLRGRDERGLRGRLPDHRGQRVTLAVAVANPVPHLLRWRREVLHDHGHR